MAFNFTNPDDDIQVATVERDGTVRIWARSDRTGARAYIRTQHFANYGQGKLYADEYESAQRAERPIGRR
jgi:hypothetical protein